MSDEEQREAALISIHAPAKGATERLEFISSYLLISIHAPAKGATARSCTVLGKN